jgi:release factor glutamine methyltransferase
MPNTTSSNDQPWTVLKLISWTTSYFKSHQIDSPRTDAEILLAHVLNCRRIDLYLRYDQPLSVVELNAYKSLIKRRRHREPVAYIVGQKGFWSFDLRVSPDVLVPRPETECVVESALDQLPETRGASALRVLELGTGTGAIILALAIERPGHCFVATDISLDALRVARANADKLGVSDNINFCCTNWFEAFSDKRSVFDLIIANPPYIPTAQIDLLQPEIVQYEPRQALDGGIEGLDFLRHILKEAIRYLRSGGALTLEMGSDQRQALKDYMKSLPDYSHVQFYRDYSDQDRIIQAIKK